MAIDTTSLNQARYILETRFGPNTEFNYNSLREKQNADADQIVLTQAIHHILDFINQQITMPGDPQP